MATLPVTNLVPRLSSVVLRLILTGELKICLQVSIVSGPVMRTITLAPEVGELTAKIVSFKSYIRHCHPPCHSRASGNLRYRHFWIPVSAGMTVVAALHIFVKRLGLFLFDFAAGLARRGNQTLRFGLFLFPDVFANDMLLKNTGEGTCHNIQIHSRRGLV